MSSRPSFDALPFGSTSIAGKDNSNRKLKNVHGTGSVFVYHYRIIDTVKYEISGSANQSQVLICDNYTLTDSQKQIITVMKLYVSGFGGVSLLKITFFKYVSIK